jgi:hypothetical protein
MSTLEGAILKQILDYLAARHIFAMRMNTGAVASEYKGKKRFMRFGTLGMADILAFPQIKINGTLRTVCSPFPVWIEVKSPEGKQSKLQRSFQEKVENEGHKYIIARSKDDVEAAL